METITIEESKFRFEEFTRKILEFLNDILREHHSKVNPSSLILRNKQMGEVINEVEYGPEEGSRDFWEELKTGRELFFPFSEQLDTDEWVDCADGEVRQVDRVKSWAVGFSVEIKEGNFIIDSAYYYHSRYLPPSPPAVESVETEFDEPMENFIWSFVSTG